jgi:hypothetical protein
MVDITYANRSVVQMSPLHYHPRSLKPTIAGSRRALRWHAQFKMPN